MYAPAHGLCTPQHMDYVRPSPWTMYAPAHGLCTPQPMHVQASNAAHAHTVHTTAALAARVTQRAKQERRPSARESSSYSPMFAHSNRYEPTLGCVTGVCSTPKSHHDPDMRGAQGGQGPHLLLVHYGALAGAECCASLLAGAPLHP